MGLLQPPTPLPGQEGIIPQTKKMITTDTYETITQPGYLNVGNLGGNTLSPTDTIECIYQYDAVAQTFEFDFFFVQINDGVITIYGW